MLGLICDGVEEDFVLVGGEGADRFGRWRRRPRCSSAPCTGRSCRSPAGPGRPRPSSRRSSRSRRGCRARAARRGTAAFSGAACSVSVGRARPGARGVAGGSGGTSPPSLRRRLSRETANRAGLPGQKKAPERVSGPVERGAESSIGAVPDLTRNAVDVLPEGRLAEQLKLDRPLRVKLGIDPTTADIHLGHTVVLGKLAEFQAAGPHGRPDRRRLHRPGRRSERALGLAAGADARRRSRPTRRPTRSRPTRSSTRRRPRCGATASGST